LTCINVIPGPESDLGGRVADPGDQERDHRFGVGADAPEGVGGKRALKFQAEVDQADVGAGDPAGVDRCPLWVEGAELAQVVQAGPVSGGQDDRVDRLALAVAPGHLVSVQRGEHRAPVNAAVSEGLLEPDAVGDHAAAGDLAQPFGGQGVEATLAQPVVDVLAAQPLGDEPHGMAGGQRDRRDRRELVGDLGGGVARADDDHPLAGVRRWVAVVGDVRKLAGEGVLAREGRAVGVGE
jgi:hypothetical protein